MYDDAILHQRNGKKGGKFKFLLHRIYLTPSPAPRGGRRQGPSIRSSSGGQDEAIGTPYALVASPDVQMLTDITAIYIR